jgi:hypothetical protein
MLTYSEIVKGSFDSSSQVELSSAVLSSDSTYSQEWPGLGFPRDPNPRISLQAASADEMSIPIPLSQDIVQSMGCGTKGIDRRTGWKREPNGGLRGGGKEEYSLLLVKTFWH